MKIVCKYALLGILVGVIGFAFTALFSDLMDGMTMETAAALGIGVYVCVVVVVCTGIILSKIDNTKK